MGEIGTLHSWMPLAFAACAEVILVYVTSLQLEENLNLLVVTSITMNERVRTGGMENIFINFSCRWSLIISRLRVAICLSSDKEVK